MIRLVSQKRTRPRVALFAGALMLSVVILGTNAIILNGLRESTQRSVENHLSSLGIMLAEQTDRSFKILDLTLSIISDYVARQDVNDSQALQRKLAGQETHRWLTDKKTGMMHVDAIALISAHGKLINFSRYWPIPEVDVSDRDYFQVMKAAPDLETFISKPFQSKATGIWMISLARRLNAPDGEFMGLVVGAVTLQYFEGFFRSISVDEGSEVALLREDGTLLARHPHSSAIETIMPSLAPASRARMPTVGLTTSPFDGQQRIVSARSLAQFPLRVAVSLTEESALRSWSTIAHLSNSIATGSVVMILFMAVLMTRWWHQQECLTEDLRCQNLRFNAALANMAGGLCMFNAEKRLVVCNDRYAKLYQLPSELLKVGTPHRAIIAHRVSHGILKGDTCDVAVEQKIAALSELPAYANSSRTDELTDGRLICVTRQSMADGGWVAMHDDVTEQRRSEAKIVHMAQHDALTGLPNRVLLRERVERGLTGMRRGDRRLAVLLLDLDRFKDVNDTLGHSMGDKLLQAVADRLRRTVRETDTVARLGGDEFAIVQGGVESINDVTSLARQLVELARMPYEIDGHQIEVGASIGIALAPADGDTPEQLMRSADLALYRAKEMGRGGYHVFEPALDQRLQKRRALEVELRTAIMVGQFELHYQPILTVSTKDITGVEALIRWRHPERGLISPADFIPLAEATGLIVPIGEWAIRQACETVAPWPQHIRVAVNLSPVQFKKQGLAQTVVSALASSGLAPQRLELEITESVLLDSSEQIITTLHQLKALGTRIAMDDFGTGYSSLSYLQSFPFDKIKIDRAFIKNLGSSESSSDIVQAIVSLAQALKMSVTAEGVETDQQFAIVRQKGCTEVQGYLFSPPRPPQDIERLYFSATETLVAAA